MRSPLDQVDNNTNPEFIKAEIRIRFGSMSELGRRHKVKPATLWKCLTVCCPAGNRLIARALGRPVQSLWPEWFDEHGHRRRSGAREKSSRQNADGHRQKFDDTLTSQTRTAA
jgi:lambda repressor-like predicted transcriptional regulator